MAAIHDKASNPVGRTAILLPVLAVLLNLAGSFLGSSGKPGVATALILTSFLLAFASVPFAGVVAIQARRADRARLKRALIGFSLGLGFSAFLVCGTWLVNAKTRAIQEHLENKGPGTGQPATGSELDSEAGDGPQPDSEGRPR